MDPRNPEELRQLENQIAEIPNRFPGSYSIHETELVHFILNLQSIDEIQYLPVGDTSRMLDIAFDAEANSAMEYNRWYWEQNIPDFSSLVNSADDPSQSPRRVGLELVAPGAPVAPRRWHVDAIPFTRFATHHRLVHGRVALTPSHHFTRPPTTRAQAPPVFTPTIFRKPSLARDPFLPLASSVTVLLRVLNFH